MNDPALRELLLHELLTRELSRRSYSRYLAYVHGPAWRTTRLSAFLAGEVQDFIERETGHAYDILIVNCPPQHGKSMTVTESLPAWYLGRYPENNVIVASYDSDFAERFCRKNKDKIRSFGKTLFGIGIGGVDRSSEFELSNKKGRMISRGLMSGITGNPANLVIIDDPVKNRQEADSPAYRDRVWQEWQSSVKSRLAAGSKVIVIMTPWREDCFDAELLKSEKNVRQIRLPVEAEENDPLGRLPGEPLCPELGKDAAWLRDFRESYVNDPLGGRRAWNAMYLCAPRAEEGGLVKRTWWKYYTPAGAELSSGSPEPEAYDTQLISVDAAFKGDESSDFVSIQVWGASGRGFYLRYCLNRHLNFPETLSAIRSVSALYPGAHRILVEEAANGAAIIQTLQKELFVIPVEPRGGKISRVNAVSAAIESGHVFLPDPAAAPWVSDFVDQFTAFPQGKHDDMVDAASQALGFLIRCTASPGSPEAEDGSGERAGEADKALCRDLRKAYDRVYSPVFRF